MERNIGAFFTGRSQDRSALFARGDILLPGSIPPYRLKILIVVDGNATALAGSISFSHSFFGLSAVLDTLRDNPEFFVKFDVTRAHRQKDLFKPDIATHPDLYEKYAPHFENFRFTQPGFNLNDYHQVWLFGYRDNPHEPEGLSDDELEALARWMDEKKGGLFAAGDHHQLGASLCSRVPRVRTMRKWLAPDIPPAIGPHRHDTARKGHNDVYEIDDESDDVPMPIMPRTYLFRSWNPFRVASEPHPILCGSDGVINILPDHPHEGEIIKDEEVDLSQTIDFRSYVRHSEYPTVGDVQPRPEVIAYAQVLSDHTSTDYLGEAIPKIFGAIGAYNGHRANVGRVVVDSSWHHWFDVNLTGKFDPPQGPNDPKTKGFCATPEGLAAFARIRNYYRNVGIWLSSPVEQRGMFLRAIWGLLQRYPLNEMLRPALPIWEMGAIVLNAIGLGVSQCLLRWWITDLFPLELRDIFEEQSFSETGPCLTCPPYELFEIYILGGGTRELLTLASGLNAENEIDVAAVEASFVRGAKLGLSELSANLDSSTARNEELTRKLEKLSKGVLT